LGYSEIANALRTPAGASNRYKRLNALDRLLDNSFFDDLGYSFEVEEANGEYLPLTKRRPSVKYNLARIVVDQSSGSLWADDEMARIACGSTNSPERGDAETAQDQKNVDAILIDCQLDAVMMEAYEKSASGSGAIIVDVDANGMPTFTCLQGKFVRATWATTGSQILQTLEYVYPTTAADLLAVGESMPKDVDPNAPYWVKVAYTAQATIYYKPLAAVDYESLGQLRGADYNETIIRWEMRSAIAHDWGIVNAVYLRSLLFGNKDDDGRCAYEDCADIQVEMARILSQIGRGIRYAADPLLVRERGEIGSATAGIANSTIDMFGDSNQSRELVGPNGETIRSASNVIEGKARLLEMTGSGLETGLSYVKTLREWGLEVAGAMKADAASTEGPAMSGRALEVLQQMLRLLVKRQRIAYGQRGLLLLVRVILAGCAAGILAIDDVVEANPRARMRCEWPTTVLADSTDADMRAEMEQIKIDAEAIASGIYTVNEIREKRGLGPLEYGNQPFLKDKGPWTGGSALGPRPTDESAVPQDSVGAADEADKTAKIPSSTTSPERTGLPG